MSGRSPYGPRDHVDELHDLPDAERKEEFRRQLQRNPLVAVVQLVTLSQRYGLDALLLMVLLEQTEHRLVDLEMEIVRLREKIP